MFSVFLVVLISNLIFLMASRLVKKFRCDDSLQILMKGGRAVFFTLTTPDEVCLVEIRRRWRNLRNWLVRRLHNPLYVMNYELHPGYLQKEVRERDGSLFLRRSDGHSHGWHIHGVMNCFVPLKELLKKIQSFGFGRVDVRMVNSKGISDYLTKHALKAYRGLTAKERREYGNMRLRLVNTSRGLPSLSWYRFESPHLDNQRNMLDEWRSEFDERVKIPFAAMRQQFLRSEVLCLAGFTHLWEWFSFFEKIQNTHLRELKNFGTIHADESKSHDC